DLRFRPWEVVDIRYKAGPRKSTKCDDYKNYSTYRRVPITIKKKDSPIRFCMYGLDQAGNIGAIFFEDFGEQK
ncbi:trypsin, partial [Enterobacter hormaechei]|nr:trypsin [Enterobacter hormaechei]